MPYAAAFVDLDGTVWRGREAAPGAARGLRALRDAGVSVAFVTNNTSVGRGDLAARLDAIDVPHDGHPVVTAAWATAAYLSEHRPDAAVHAMGQRAVEAELEAAGLSLATEGRADVVVVGLDERTDFDRLTRSLRAFGPGTVFVATNRDRTTPSPDGRVPGANAFVSAVEGMVDQEPLVIGKPETRMAELAAARLGVPVGDCLMVGDNLETDVLMGERAGMDTALVLTGVTSREAVAASTIEPTYVLDDLRDVADLF